MQKETTIKSVGKDIYKITLKTGKPTHYYVNGRVEINNEIYRIVDMISSDYNFGDRIYKFLAYKRPQVGAYNYNNLDFAQITSIERETPTINLIKHGNQMEIRYKYKDAGEALKNFLILRKIHLEESTNPWTRLI